MAAEDGMKEEVIEILKRWEGKSFDEVTAGVCRPEAIEAMNSGILSIGGLETSTGHILPNYFRLFDGGLAGAIEDCEKNIKETKVARKRRAGKGGFLECRHHFLQGLHQICQQVFCAGERDGRSRNR